METAADFALEAIESPEGRHASATENAEHALEHLRSLERRLDFPKREMLEQSWFEQFRRTFFCSTCELGYRMGGLYQASTKEKPTAQ